MSDWNAVDLASMFAVTVEPGRIVLESAGVTAGPGGSFRLRTDASTTYGGWNIDDVEVYVTTVPVALPAELRMLPEQTIQGSPVTATVHTQAAAPFVHPKAEPVKPSAKEQVEETARNADRGTTWSALLQ